MFRKLKTSYLLFFLVFSTLIFSEIAEAGSVRIRLREHFDLHFIRFGELDESADYYGMSNTINLWWEEPMKWAVGLAFNPILGGASVNGTAPAGTGDDIKLWNFGFEGKYFFWSERESWINGFFARGGVFLTVLDTDGVLGNIFGGTLYAGGGYEIPVWKIGIVPEVAFRGGFFERDTQVLVFTPSIAVHFYLF